jgi:hypothetical protein
MIFIFHFPRSNAHIFYLVGEYPEAKIHLKSNFIELWRDQMLQQTNGKLRTYIAFKSNFGLDVIYAS